MLKAPNSNLPLESKGLENWPSNNSQGQVQQEKFFGHPWARSELIPEPVDKQTPQRWSSPSQNISQSNREQPPYKQCLELFSPHRSGSLVSDKAMPNLAKWIERPLERGRQRRDRALTTPSDPICSIILWQLPVSCWRAGQGNAPAQPHQPWCPQWGGHAAVGSSLGPCWSCECRQEAASV